MAPRAPHERVRSQLVPHGAAHLLDRKPGVTLCGLSISVRRRHPIRLEPGEPGRTCVQCRNRWRGATPLEVKRRIPDHRAIRIEAAKRGARGGRRGGINLSRWLSAAGSMTAVRHLLRMGRR
jgi:hypothetical protein